MRKPPKLLLLATVAAAAAAAAIATSVATAGAPTTLTYVVRNNGTEFVTASGSSSSSFPGRLATGDRIFTRDALLRAGRQVGYDNELCTVTFDANDLCHSLAVIKGKGSIEITWLWVGRNLSENGPARFNGIIDGGTGAYAKATGQFTALVLANGELQFSAPIS
jgi:hypothetical protein